MSETLTFPIKLTTRGLATLEQGSEADIVQSVQLLLETRPGERRSVPGYGLHDQLFGELDKTEVAAAVAEWEPRADLDLLELELIDLTNSTDTNYGQGLYGDGPFGG